MSSYREQHAPQTHVEIPVPPTVAPGGVEQYDVVIVGGGPAGLSAALILGRCRRSVLVCDSGHPRNISARAMHGYLTRDGMAPAEFLTVARDQLSAYDCVRLRNAEVVDATTVGTPDTPDGGFLLTLADATKVACRRLLLATGLVDELPEVDGLRELYGKSVHHCPICDGWEWRDRAVAIYGKQDKGFGFAQELTAWTRDIVVLTDGPSELLDKSRRDWLATLQIRIEERPIARLQGDPVGQLRRVIFRDGPPLDRDALFFCTSTSQRSNLASRLGCKQDDRGCVWTTVGGEETSCKGVYSAGDATRNAQLVIVAAAEGAQAAVAINKSLTADYKVTKKRARKAPVI